MEVENTSVDELLEFSITYSATITSWSGSTPICNTVTTSNGGTDKVCVCPEGQIEVNGVCEDIVDKTAVVSGNQILYEVAGYLQPDSTITINDAVNGDVVYNGDFAMTAVAGTGVMTVINSTATTVEMEVENTSVDELLEFSITYSATITSWSGSTPICNTVTTSNGGTDTVCVCPEGQIEVNGVCEDIVDKTAVVSGNQILYEVAGYLQPDSTITINDAVNGDVVYNGDFAMTAVAGTGVMTVINSTATTVEMEVENTSVDELLEFSITYSATITSWSGSTPICNTVTTSNGGTDTVCMSRRSDRGERCL
ncbi:MAG: hypothetical protein H6765_10650 [Candidatus Peribacteria bacterium]|nr:MAG: hypothetical protein H6765_10650 [Candidatus Peribacteria bacterium]